MNFTRKGSLIVFVTGWNPGTSSTSTVHVLESQGDAILGTSLTEIKFELSGLFLGYLAQLLELSKS